MTLTEKIHTVIAGIIGVMLSLLLSFFAVWLLSISWHFFPLPLQIFVWVVGIIPSYLILLGLYYLTAKVWILVSDKRVYQASEDGFYIEQRGRLTAYPSLRDNSYKMPVGTRVVEEKKPEHKLIGKPLIPTFRELLECGMIEAYEDESILGFTHGKEKRGMWDKLYSFMVLGISGSGKSSTVAYYTALSVLHGARLLLIDPDAEEEGSLTQRLGALINMLLTPVATNPKGVERILKIAEKELEHPSDYPLVFLVDEFSSIMRDEKWASVSQKLSSMLEGYAQRGRKRKRICIVLGQVGKASRTGGTELRSSMTATFIHRLPVQQARLVIDPDTAKECANLDTGEVIVLLSNSSMPYRMHIPQTQIDDMQEVLQLIAPISDRFTPSEIPSFIPEIPFQSVSKNEAEMGMKQERNTDEIALQARVTQIEKLYKNNVSQTKIIEEVYGVKPGGTQAYQVALKEYKYIVASNTQKVEEGEIA
jgi:hypothetical protein